MSLVVNTNVSSLTSQRHLSINTKSLNRSIERLASGFRINRAGDDAAGLQVAENLSSQVRGSKKALANVQDGINVLSIADGTLSVMTEHLQRMRELTVQAANDTYDATQRSAIKQELDSRASDITRISNATQFNGVFLLDGSTDGAGNFVLQVGPNAVAANDTIDIGATGAFAQVDDASLGIDSASTNVTTNTNSLTTLTAIDAAITQVNTQRATLGSIVNQLESSARNLMVNIENMSASESRVRDVDVAAESAELVRSQILQQSSATVLAQANQAPTLALQLLQG